MTGEEPWRQIMRRAPFVCEVCSRRFQRLPVKGYCPNHLPGRRVKVTDQSALIASWPSP